MVPLLSTTPTQLIDHGEVKVGPIFNLHSYVPALLVQDSILQDTK